MTSTKTRYQKWLILNNIKQITSSEIIPFAFHYLFIQLFTEISFSAFSDNFVGIFILTDRLKNKQEKMCKYNILLSFILLVFGVHQCKRISFISACREIPLLDTQVEMWNIFSREVVAGKWWTWTDTMELRHFPFFHWREN